MNDSGLSQVVSTVVLVSVAIVVTVTSSYWMGTLTVSYTAVEEIGVSSIYARWDSNLFANGGWNISVNLKNSGSTDAIINELFLNDVTLKDHSAGSIFLYDESAQQVDLSSISILIAKGALVRLTLQIEIYCDGDGVEGCTHHTNIALRVNTASGRDYLAQTKLP